MSIFRQETITKAIDIKKSWTTFWNALQARQGVVAYLPIIAVNLFIFCVASWQFLWLNTDPARYQCYALTFWLGSNGTKFLPATQCSFLPLSTLAQPPFQMLPLEYPPFTLVIFSLPLIVPLLYYQMFFAVLMAVFSALIYWLLLRYGPRGAGLAFAFYLLIGTFAIAVERFDLVPAALTLICLISADRKHWTTAYIALAFGFLLKIYPFLFLPALFMAEQQDRDSFYKPATLLTLKTLPGELWNTLSGVRKWHWKNTLLFSFILLTITGFFALFDFKGAVLSQVSYFANRPLQVESIGSIILWLAARFGSAVHILYSFGSINMISAPGAVVSNLLSIVFVAGYVYCIFLQWRGKLDLLQTCIALLLVFIASGKVFSPQYLIWVIPLLAYSGAFDRFWLVAWGSISLLTTIIYPYLYTRVIDPEKIPYVQGFIQFVTVRDVFFVLLTLAYLFNWFHIRRRQTLPFVEKVQDVSLQSLMSGNEK